MLRKRSSLTEVKITILGKSFRQSSRKSKSPGRAIWLTAFEIKVPSRSRAKTFSSTSGPNIVALNGRVHRAAVPVVYSESRLYGGSGAIDVIRIFLAVLESAQSRLKM
jgi:hypothetical protein